MKITIRGIAMIILFLILIPFFSAFSAQKQYLEKPELQCQIYLNSPPDKPSLWGATNCETEVTYYYYARTSDPDNDRIRYAFDFGDGCGHTVACCYESGETCETFHCWKNLGTFSVTVVAIDEHCAYSEPSNPLTVSVPKSYDDNSCIWPERVFEWVLQNSFKVTI